jgi:hypothetical protein
MTRNITALRRIAFLSIFILPAVLLLAAGGIAGGKPAVKDLKILKGTWTCPICDAKGLKGGKAECEDLGHKHALRLDDGKYVTFVENARSEALVVGGGRHNTRVEVCGLYDPSTHVIDLDSFEIDGIWSTWCEKDGRMDMCRAQAMHDGGEVSQQVGR